MFVNLAASIAILISLIVVGATADPNCDDYYGRPVGDDCRRILEALCGPRPAREPVRCFAPASMTQPEFVSNSEWVQKVEIPKFWTRNGNPGCRVALLPLKNVTDGSLSYDLSRYLGIQSVGFGINHYCVEALGIPGLQGKGGIDSTGDNQKLRIILYAPLSKFENDTIESWKNNEAVAIPEATDNENNQATPPPKRRRTDERVAYDSATSIVPTQVAAARLQAFYTQVVLAAAKQISNIVNATANLAFQFGGLNLRLSSSAPISWTWVLNFAADMLNGLGTDFAMLFTGQAYSAYSDMATVTTSLTIL